MKSHRFAVLGLAGLTLWMAPARADLTWEHSGQLRLTKFKQPVMKFKVFTNLTPSRHRMMFQYVVNPTALGGMGGMMGGPKEMQAFGASLGVPIFALAQMGGAEPNPLQGSVAMVQRFDDGQFIAYASLPGKYVSEPIQDMLTKYRFDPWKKMAPKLSQNEPPVLTQEQRARLGAEVRAAIAPYTGRVWKTYFRELSEKRTIAGMEGHGYRLTMLFNTENPFAGAGRWVRVAMEWWVAGELPGDEDVAKLREAALKTIGRDYKSSTSMWLNETPRVMWEMLPEEIHQAAYTLFPPPDAATDSAEFKRANMPLTMTLTISLPPGLREQTGDIVAELNLVRRSTDALPERVFEAPPGYKRVPLEDIMKQFEEAAKSAKPPIPGM